MSSLLRSAATVAACTVLTRVLGYLRDLSLAARFGSSPAVDAYLQAYRVVDLTVYLLAAGGATASVVPLLVRRREEHGPDQGWRLLRSVFRQAAWILCLLLCLELATAPALAALLGPGFTPATQALTADLIRAMLPAMVLLGFSALAGAALNSLGSFAIPVLGWAVLDVAILVATLLAPADDIRPVAFGVVAGAAGFLLLQMLGLHYLGFRWRGPGDARTHELGKAFASSASVLFCAYLYLEIAAAMASTAGDGWVMLLRYANRLLNVPLGLIGSALSVALLPELSRAVVQGKREHYRRSRQRATRLCWLLCLPPAAVFILWPLPLVELLFGHGRFTADDCARLASLTSRLAWGLPAASQVMLQCQALYAQGQFRQALLAMALPLLVAAALFGLALPLQGVPGLATVLGLCPWVQLGLLLAAQRTRADS